MKHDSKLSAKAKTHAAAVKAKSKRAAATAQALLAAAELTRVHNEELAEEAAALEAALAEDHRIEEEDQEQRRKWESQIVADAAYINKVNTPPAVPDIEPWIDDTKSGYPIPVVKKKNWFQRMLDWLP